MHSDNICYKRKALDLTARRFGRYFFQEFNAHKKALFELKII